MTLDARFIHRHPVWQMPPEQTVESRNNKVAKEFTLVDHLKDRSSSHLQFASKMGKVRHGALGTAFSIVRLLQIVGLLACVGLAANSVSQVVQASATSPRELVGTLSVVRIHCILRLHPCFKCLDYKAYL